MISVVLVEKGSYEHIKIRICRQSNVINSGFLTGSQIGRKIITLTLKYYIGAGDNNSITAREMIVILLLSIAVLLSCAFS